jgi:hypothetical protein
MQAVIDWLREVTAPGSETQLRLLGSLVVGRIWIQTFQSVSAFLGLSRPDSPSRSRTRS